MAHPEQLIAGGLARVPSMPCLAWKAACPKGYQPLENAVVRDLGAKCTRDTDLPAAAAVAPLSCHAVQSSSELNPQPYTLRPTNRTLNPSVMPSNLREN